MPSVGDRLSPSAAILWRRRNHHQCKAQSKEQLPNNKILLLDVMVRLEAADSSILLASQRANIAQDTLVRDPFFKQMPSFFDLTFEELMKAKHPTAWVEFETGEINEAEMFNKFFKDRRQFDGDALRQIMVGHAIFLDLVQVMLACLTSLDVPKRLPVR